MNPLFLFFLCISWLSVACASQEIAPPLSPVPERSLSISPLSDEQATPSTSASEDEFCGIDEIEGEMIGELGFGLTEAAVQKILGAPEDRSKAIFQEANGEWITTWNYPALGIVLDMTSVEANPKEFTIGGVTIQSPCTKKTTRGIGIGSKEEEVLKAYAGTADPKFTVAGEKFVAGSVYGGVFFDFKEGKVVRIFMGVGAE